MEVYCRCGEELKQVDVFGAAGVGIYVKPCQECIDEKVEEAQGEMRHEIEDLYNEIDDNLTDTLKVVSRLNEV